MIRTSQYSRPRLNIESASYRTIKRRLPAYATADFRDQITRACARHAGIVPEVVREWVDSQPIE